MSCFGVLVSLGQLVGTMHKICKVRDSNPDQYQKKMSCFGVLIDYVVLYWTGSCSWHILCQFSSSLTNIFRCCKTNEVWLDDRVKRVTTCNTYSCAYKVSDFHLDDYSSIFYAPHIVKKKLAQFFLFI